MQENNYKKLRIKIQGMHCTSCEVLIESKFKKIGGIEKAEVNHAKGVAELTCSKEPDIQELDKLINEHGYKIVGTEWVGPGGGVVKGNGSWENSTTTVHKKNTSRDYGEIGAIALLVFALYLMLKRLGVVSGFDVSDNMTYGFVFMIGLVAAVSTCMAVTGGLVVAAAAKYNELHSNLSAVAKFKPHIYFNLGRIVSYTVFGGLVGLLGSAISISPRLNGIIIIVVSIVMIVLGLGLLNLFPGLKKFQPKMPKFISHFAHDFANKDTKRAPLMLGAATFFLPCGFTQALQLYVLSKGSFGVGALTMFFFALGTLPALMSLGFVSSFAKGQAQKYFVKVAGVVVIMIGLFNINNGLALSGGVFSAAKKTSGVVAQDPNVQIKNGKQYVKMRVDGYDYYPNRFTVVKNIPVVWEIDGTRAQGCVRVLVSPKLKVSAMLPQVGTKTIEFTPTEEGEVPFNCSMGMATPNSAFVVVSEKQKPALPSVGPAKCDPRIANCLSI